MQYNIKKNWLTSLEMMTTKPIVIIPFIIIAFLECLMLEVAYFSNRIPLSLVAVPIIRKFFGESLLHYPGNLILLPMLFYYGQVTIYILFGVFLTAISVNIFKNLKEGLPVIPNALIKNNLKNYFRYFIYGALIVALIVLAQKADTFVFVKAMRLISKFLPRLSMRLFNLILTLCLFFTNIILQILFIWVIPIIVIEKKSLLKAIGSSLRIGIRNFFTVFGLLFLPFLVYLPLTILKSFSAGLVDTAFPEITIFITIAGIIAAIFLDCFIILCASQFVMERGKRNQ